MKKQILTAMAVAIFSLSGIAFAESGTSFPVNMSGESAFNMEMPAMQPDSSGKQKQSMMDKKAEMHGKMMQMQNRQGKDKKCCDSAHMAKMMKMHKMMMHKMDTQKQQDTDRCGHMKMYMKSTSKLPIRTNREKITGIVRNGVIDVAAIDKNKDGILYQDVMDWNVISDKPGNCPLCGMKLRKMTIKQVRQNLKAHGLQYK